MAISFGPKITPAFVAALLGDNYLNAGNALLRAFQTLVQPNVISIGLTTPPGSPVNGDTYIVGVGGTGAWSGHDKTLANWTTDNPVTPSGLWEFYVPKQGWIVSNQIDNLVYIYNGTVWSQAGGVAAGQAVYPTFSTIGGHATGGVGPPGRTYASVISGRQLVSTPSKWNFSISVNGGGVQLDTVVVLKTLIDDLNVISSTPVLFGGISPAVLADGIHTSDTISLQLDTAHDYYVMYLVDELASAGWVDYGPNVSPTAYLAALGHGEAWTGDQTAANPIVIPSSIGRIGSQLNQVLSA